MNNPFEPPKVIAERPDSIDEPKRNSLTRRICIAGILLFITSLALPSVKHGRALLGIECFFFSTLGAFQETHGVDLVDRKVWMSRAAVLAHVACFAVAVSVMCQIAFHSVVKYTLSTAILFVCFLFLIRPDFGIEARYFGYFVWLISMTTISISQHTNCLGQPRNA